MTHGFLPRLATVCLAAAAILSSTPRVSAQQNPTAPITLTVDATEAPRRFLRATLVIPAQPGPLTLYYPKWIPGEHGPTGPIADLAGLKVSVAGKPIAWQRDDVDMYAFHCNVRAGADAVEVSLTYLAPTPAGGFSSGASTSAQLAVLNWNQFVLYPKGTPARDLRVRASIRLPKGWKSASALPHLQKADLVAFDPVSLETLIDSPVLCGRHLRDITLDPENAKARHSIAVACDFAGGAEIDAALKANFDRLVDEAGRLFGARPYRGYKFLLALSDSVAHFGLEHHESSDNRAPERLLADARLKKTNWGQLLPHEYVHAWNGKYRRPLDMVTDDFQKPQRTRMLWVYEGLTQYLGVVLTARCGIWTPEQFRDNLAMVAAWAGNQRGRTWRPLEDTAVAAQFLYGARGEWGAWRRGVDFYDEGILLWLDVDTLIRQKSGGKKSLDDFCRRFFTSGPDSPRLRPYTLDDLTSELNGVVTHDWKTFFAKRLTGADAEPPLDGLKRGGWKLAFGEKQSDFQTANDEDGKTADFSSSLGLLLKEDGYVTDVIPDLPAHKAGVGPAMKLIAVNGRRFSPQVLRDNLGADKKGGGIVLLLESGDYFHTFKLDYQGGSRYPRLERDSAVADLLGAILQPLAPMEK